jgi:hypothetical protein
MSVKPFEKIKPGPLSFTVENNAIKLSPLTWPDERCKFWLGKGTVFVVFSGFCLVDWKKDMHMSLHSGQPDVQKGATAL